MMFLASLGCAVAVGVLILRAWKQRGHLPMLAPDREVASPPRIAIIVPARNEAENIAPCLHGLLAQDYPRERLVIIVIDDNSSDDTEKIVARLAGANTHLSLLRAPPLTRGWTGKSHACWIAAQAAAADVEWLCFLDADMRSEAGLLRSALAAAVERKLDLLSLAPRHRLVSFAERLMIPCGLFFLAFYQDLGRLQAPCSDGVTANGQFMLVRRAAYRGAGGHAAVRAAICEDMALARLLKRSGRAVLMMDGASLLATRMYTGWSSLWEGFSKNLSEMLGGTSRTLLCAAAALVVAWALLLVPLADTVSWRGAWNGVSLALALSALAAFAGLHIAGARHFRIPFWYGFLFPLGYSIGAMMALNSLHCRMAGRVTWKGRVYP